MLRPASLLLLAFAAFAEDKVPATRLVLAGELTMIEREIVPLAEAMPAAKYGFAPREGAFEGARTFGQQVTHIAAVLYACAAAVLEEKNPIDMGAQENGPAALQSKEEMVGFLKQSIAYARKALATLTDANAALLVPSAFDPARKVARLSMANVIVWHSMDHYGQMVVYSRLNGVVPPASRR